MSGVRRWYVSTWWPVSGERAAWIRVRKAWVAAVTAPYVLASIPPLARALGTVGPALGLTIRSLVYFGPPIALKSVRSYLAARRYWGTGMAGWIHSGLGLLRHHWYSRPRWREMQELQHRIACLHEPTLTAIDEQCAAYTAACRERAEHDRPIYVPGVTKLDTEARAILERASRDPEVLAFRARVAQAKSSET